MENFETVHVSEILKSTVRKVEYWKVVRKGGLIVYHGGNKDDKEYRKHLKFETNILVQQRVRDYVEMTEPYHDWVRICDNSTINILPKKAQTDMCRVEPQIGVYVNRPRGSTQLQVESNNNQMDLSNETDEDESDTMNEEKLQKFLGMKRALCVQNQLLLF